MLGQTEDSIRLMWQPVNAESTYILKYKNNGDAVEVVKESSESNITIEVSSLTPKTIYNFTLITAFGELNSTGFIFQGITGKISFTTCCQWLSAAPLPQPSETTGNKAKRYHDLFFTRISVPFVFQPLPIPRTSEKLTKLRTV